MGFQLMGWWFCLFCGELLVPLGYVVDFCLMFSESIYTMKDLSEGELTGAYGC
jgi:hypothetical protein